jgi:lactate dehydrogenase-like 2-hydroxyacid dehydrogenase
MIANQNQLLQGESFETVRPLDMNYEKTRIAILGTGNIGSRVLEYYARLGFSNIVYYGRGDKGKLNNTALFEPDLSKIFQNSDIIVNTLQFVKGKTEGIINGDLLNILKNTATFVSVSRGGVIDEKALLNKIINSQTQIAVDTFNFEGMKFFSSDNPLNPNQRGQKMEILKEKAQNGQIMFTPHSYWSDSTAVRDMNRLLLSAARQMTTNSNELPTEIQISGKALSNMQSPASYSLKKANLTFKIL